MPAGEVLRNVHMRDAAIRSLEAEGTLAIESPRVSGSAGFELQLDGPDSLWIRFSGPFGISVGTLSLSRDRFVFYNARENRLLVGVPDETTLERVFHISLSFDQVINLVRGAVGEKGCADTSSSVAVADDQYVLEQTSGRRCELRVDGTWFVTTEFSRFDETGRPVLTAGASRIEDVDGIPMPHLIHVILPGRRQRATISYDAVKINRPFTKTFSLPDNAMESYIGGSGKKYE